MGNSLAMIQMRRAAIAKLRKELDAEDADLNQAERTILRLQTKTSVDGYATALADKPPVTQRDYIVTTMRKSEIKWFESVAALRDEIKRVYNKDIKSTTFQPLVSTMTGEGILLRDGSRVGLAERIREG